jgi:hypothetical protein
MNYKDNWEALLDVFEANTPECCTLAGPDGYCDGALSDHTCAMYYDGDYPDEEIPENVLHDFHSCAVWCHAFIEIMGYEVKES